MKCCKAVLKRIMTKTGLGIILALLLIVSAAYIFNPSSFVVTGGVCGATTMSLGQATFTSTSSYWSGPQWILSVAFGGMCQSWQGLISTSDITSKSGQTPQNNFYMKIDMTKQECQYKVSTDSNMLPIWVYNYETWNKYLYDSCAGTRGDRCGVGFLQTFDVNYDINGVSIFPGTGCACIGRVPVVTAMGTLNTPVVSTESIISVSKDGLTYKSKTVKTPTGSSTVDFNDVGFPVVGIFNGYTTSGTCDDQYRQAANQFYTFYDAGWKLGSMTKYTQYTSAKGDFDTWFGTWQGLAGKSVEVVKNRVNAINSAANNARNIQDTAFANANLLDTTGATYPYYTRALVSPISTPLWTFYIKADWLGIVQPVPKASIESTAVTKCKSGEGGTISANVKNSGSAGNVNIWAACTAPFASSYSVTQMFSAGETKTVTIAFDVNTPSIVSSSCNVCAKGHGEIGNGMCVTVSATCNPQYICEPMTRICEANNVKECRSDGSGWRIITSCTSAQECSYENGQPTCKDKVPSTCGNTVCSASETCSNCPADCGQCPIPPTDLTDLYVIIGMMIATSILIASMILKSRMHKKKRGFGK